MELINLLDKRMYCGHKRQFALFKCEFCNSTVEKFLKIGLESKSCGCNQFVHLYKHGMSFNRLYYVWHSMKRRCVDNRVVSYKNYGGRGIKICNEWLDFKIFSKWALENGYKIGLTIDRIDNNGNYCPENCRFVSQKVNTRNTRRTKLSIDKVQEIKNLFLNEKMMMKDIAKIFDIHPCTVSHIMNGRVWAD